MEKLDVTNSTMLTESYLNADADKYYLNADADKYYLNADADKYYLNAEGDKYYLNSDGDKYYLNSDADGWYLNADGDKYYLNAEGDKYYLNSDGDKYYLNSDGDKYYLNASGKLRNWFKKEEDKVKKDVNKVKEDVNKKVDQGKKVVVKIKQKAGAQGKRFRNRFRKKMRQGVLFAIQHNAHGIATKLYPAVMDAEGSPVISQGAFGIHKGDGSPLTNGKPKPNKPSVSTWKDKPTGSKEIPLSNLHDVNPVQPNAVYTSSSNYKPSYVTKAIKSYNEVLQEWIKLGGDKLALNEAIKIGHNKRFLKSRKSSATGNDSVVFYGDMLGYANSKGYYDADGDDGSSTTTDNVSEVPDKGETATGVRGFIAKILSIFRRNHADENPYVAGSTDATTFQTETTTDSGNEPSPKEADDPIVKEVDTTATADDAGGATDETKTTPDTPDDGSDTIMGINKTYFWVGIGALALIGGFLLYKKFKK